MSAVNVRGGWGVPRTGTLEPRCIAYTPSLPIFSPATVDVTLTYFSSYQGQNFDPGEYWQREAFRLYSAYDAGEHKRFFTAPVFLADLGEVTEIVKATEDLPGLYVAHSDTHAKHHVSDVDLPRATSGFYASVCTVDRDVALAIKNVTVDIGFGDSESAPALKKLVGMPGSEESILNCGTAAGFLSTNCQMNDRRLAQEQGEDTEFLLTYEYQCKGNPIDVALRTDRTSSRPLERGSGPLVANIPGQGFLDLELSNPELAWASYAIRGCSLRLLRLDAMSSSATLSKWHVVASSLAQSLRDKFYIWRLAGGIESLTSWDGTQLIAIGAPIDDYIASVLSRYDVRLADCLTPDGRIKSTNLPAEWFTALRENMDMATYISLREAILDTIEMRPPLIGVREMTAAAAKLKQTLADWCKSELLAKHAEAVVLVEKFRSVRMQADVELADTLDAVSKQLGIALGRAKTEVGENR